MANGSRASMIEAFVSIDEDVEIVDLSTWEFVNASDDDEEEDSYSFDEEDSEDDKTPVRDIELFGSPVSDVSMDYHELNLHKLSNVLDGFGGDDVATTDDGSENEDDEEDEDDDDDLDDELVPRYVNDRFGRERMRKLGKRPYSKMKYSKRGPSYNKPGCFHGKHGLGLKHSLI